MFRPSFAVFAGLLVVAAFAAGCGGGDDGSTSATVTSGDSGAPTKAEFIEQGDEICTKANAVELAGVTTVERARGFKPGHAELSQTEELRLVIMPAIRIEVQEIAALVPPKGEEDKVNAIVSAYRAAVKEKIPAVLDGVSRRYDKAFELAKKYGFKVCGVL